MKFRLQNITCAKTLMAASIMLAGVSQITLAAETSGRIMALEEVIVTAQKRAESIQDAPISIAAFGERDLEKFGIDTIDDIGSKVPNLEMVAFPLGSHVIRINIRGVGQDSVELTRDPGVGTYLNGVYISRASGLSTDIADIERIEVLRGPQGTLYGRNTTGGAVNIITRAPSFGAFAFNQKVSVGNGGRYSYKTSVNLPISDQLAVKVAGVMSGRDGIVENLGTGKDFGEKDNDAHRLDVRWKPSDEVTVDYAYDRSNMQETATYYQSTTPGPTTGIPQLDFLTAVVPHKKGRSDTGTAFNFPSHYADIESHSLIVNWELENMTIKSITAQRDSDYSANQDFSAGAPFTLYFGGGETEHKQFTQELQFIGDAADSRFNYVAGFYYFEEEGDEITYNNSGTSNGYTIDNSAWALFGQGTYTPDGFDQKLHLTLGLRYSEDSREAEHINIAGGYDAEGDHDFDKVSGNLIVEYDLNEDASIYAKVVQGYKTGGFGIRSSTPARFELGFEEENLMSYEVGYKAEFMDNRVRLNTAIFFSDYEDIQVTIPELLNPSITDIFNAGEAEIVGLEADLTAVVSEGLVLTASYGYLDTDIKEVIDPITGIDITNDFVFPYAAEHSYRFDVDYTFPELSVGELSANINYSWRDDSYQTGKASDAVRPQGGAIVDSYGLLDARLTLRGISLGDTGSLSIALWGKNLADKEHMATSMAAFPWSSQMAVWGEERSYGVDLSYEC